MATAQWYTRVGSITFAWVYCPYCDDHRRTAKDADYDPRCPQPHCQLVETVQASIHATNEMPRIRNALPREALHAQQVGVWHSSTVNTAR